MVEDPIPALKKRVAELILAEIGEQHPSTAERMLGLDQTSMWRLKNGEMNRFSVQRLIRLLARINRKLEVSIVEVGPLPTRWHERMWELRNKQLQKHR